MQKFFSKTHTPRTDMAVELVSSTRREVGERIARTDIRLDEKTAKKLKKPAGRYVTVESDIVVRGDRAAYPRLIGAIAAVLEEMLPRQRNCLCAGLGNPLMTADALGSRVAARLIVTRHLKSDRGGLCAVTPNVLGVTGIESADVVAGAVEKVKPDTVIAVDSLASSATSRLAAAFQFTDTGITPGSGVANHRARLDRETLGVPVLSIGVPLVVYASTIVEEAGGDPDAVAGLIVTPKDIDVFVGDCAEIIAGALNRVIAGVEA